MSWHIHHGDVRKILKTLPSDHFDAVLSDPPYELSDDGKASPSRVALELLFPKQAHVQTDYLRRCELALLIGEILQLDRVGEIPRPPSSVPVVPVAFDDDPSLRKKNVKDTGKGAVRPAKDDACANVEAEPPKYVGSFAFKAADPIAVLEAMNSVGTEFYASGLCALNIDGCRIGEEEMSSSSTGVPLSENVAMGGGNYAREEGPKKIGRWPSNVVLDEIAAEMLDAETEGASRFFYTTKVSRAEREQGCDDLEDGPQGIGALRDGKRAGVINQQTPPGSKGANSPRADAGRTGRVKNIHPTLKAIELTRWLALMLLPPPRKDGQPRRILVPFSGAASEMIGCLQAGWDEVIGIEGQAEYIEIAKARITKGGVFSGLLDKKMRKPARERANSGPSRVRKVREG